MVKFFQQCMQQKMSWERNLFFFLIFRLQILRIESLEFIYGFSQLFIQRFCLNFLGILSEKKTQKVSIPEFLKR